MSMGNIVFEAKGIDKRFGPTVANNKVDLVLRAGEVHALAGENGSGKSTLISIICGMTKPNAGTMTAFGEEYSPKSPIEANDKGIGYVVQELGLINSLNVATNMYLGHMEKYEKMGVLKTRAMIKDATEALSHFEFKGINPSAKVVTMPVEKRKIVEIVKALTTEPKILILDETTQALSYDNRKNLYNMIRIAKERGIAILMVTHDLDEMVELSDRVTVLRDGAVSANLEGADVTVDNIRNAMVGRAIMSTHYYREDTEPSQLEEILLKGENMNYKDKIKNLNFELHAGEIVAFCGLSDAGIHDVGKAIMGITKLESGKVTAVRSGKDIKNPAQAVEEKLAYIPKDRDREALMMNANISANLYMPSAKELAGKANFIVPAKVNKFVKNAIDRFNVKCLGGRQEISALSGGNKQKISIGRWIVKDLDVIVMDCPTRGVDVSVKAYIYDLMQQLKKEGKGMILIADEMAEAIGMADRLLVMKNGEISAEIPRRAGLAESDIIEVMV